MAPSEATPPRTSINDDQQTPSATPLLIAPPADDRNAKQVTLGSSETVKLEALGPMVVNGDGTLSRIANWETMTEKEKVRTIRVVAARNRCVMICFGSGEPSMSSC
ncbi:uncharacterized protein EDB91DRAFT_361075 [Suillus paluster]|uniref:uncharacterized protein n=1 Tax=Suillus paluster TaxID=48578 RepID=UPI001B86BAC1|nr:uncharacterized protein EDB91DRAFT_361075 [Suillus paluster]KAG1740166.1 hypothetical protein EDB91DRAFT_361075 [Suillus paluster]